MLGLSAMLMAAATNWAIEFEDLRFAAPRASTSCVQAFDAGEISITDAYNKKQGHVLTVLRIKGKNLDGLRSGELLYARGSGNLPYAALVEQANTMQATIVVRVDIASDLWANPIGSVFLFRNTNNMTSTNYRMLRFSNDEFDTVIRQKLTKLMNCYDENSDRD